MIEGMPHHDAPNPSGELYGVSARTFFNRYFKAESPTAFQEAYKGRYGRGLSARMKGCSILYLSDSKKGLYLIDEWLAWPKVYPTVIVAGQSGGFRKRKKAVVEEAHSVVQVPGVLMFTGVTKGKPVLLTLRSEGTFDIETPELQKNSAHMDFWDRR